MKAMILAAGRGTRLQPMTNTKPKVLIEIGGLTMLEHQINYLKYYGVNEIIINTHHFADQVEEFIKKRNFGCRIEFSDERGQLLETGGGLKKAAWFFDDDKPFFLLGSDIYTNFNLKDLLSFHIKNKPLASLAVKKRNTTRELLIDEGNFLCGWRNVSTSEEIVARKSSKLDNFGFSVIQVLSPDIFKLMTEQGAFPLIPFYLRIASDHPIMAYACEHEWVEFGRIENVRDSERLAKAEKLIKNYSNI